VLPSSSKNTTPVVIKVLIIVSDSQCYRINNNEGVCLNTLSLHHETMSVLYHNS